MGQHIYKGYKDLMKNINKNENFIVKKMGRKNTYIITHVSSGEIRTVHPGEKACKPLKKWINRHL